MHVGVANWTWNITEINKDYSKAEQVGRYYYIESL